MEEKPPQKRIYIKPTPPTPPKQENQKGSKKGEKELPRPRAATVERETGGAYKKRDITVETLTYGDVKTALWLRGELNWKLDELQRRITRTVNHTGYKKICILSSRQIGKTYWACVYAIMYLLRNPGKIARVIAPTYTQCQDLVNDNLMRIMSDAPGGLLKRSKTDYRYNFQNGSSLRLGALERQYVDGNRGGNASLIIYEECGFVKSDEFDYGVNSVLGPQLLRSNGVEIFVSSPSEEPDHSLHTKVLPECEQYGTAFRYTVYDSPSLTNDQIESAQRRCGGADTDAWKREYLAQIIRVTSRVIIPDFDVERHVHHFNLPRPGYYQLTADWGGIRDLTVALIHTYDFTHDKLMIWDELVFPRNTPTAQAVKEMRERWKDLELHQKTADVPGQIFIDLHEMGFEEWHTPPKADWLAGVQAMSNLFTRDRIMIHPRCKFLIRSCRGGVFNKNRTDFERFEEPDGIGHCDALAALMYANRVQNRANAAREQGWMNPDGIFVVNKDERDKEQELALADMLPGNKWGGVKSFGRFRG